MLNIQALDVTIDEKTILKDLSLDVADGEVHVIMGLNGTGKSTLLKAIAGSYEVSTAGNIVYNDNDIGALSADERAQKGVFMSFQNPIEIPGVNMVYFLKSILNAKLEKLGLEAMDSISFLKLLDEKLELLHMDRSFLQRAINVGFSGGEKKRNEILQMLLLEPSLILLDEIDSGVDIDALKDIALGINTLRDGKRSFVMVTHYSRLLEYVKPDKIHILHEGKIVKSGDATLVKRLEEEGYEHVLNT